jgi:hypothetical protein
MTLAVVAVSVAMVVTVVALPLGEGCAGQQQGDDR